MDEIDKKLCVKLDIQTPQHLATSIALSIQEKIHTQQAQAWLIGFGPPQWSWVFVFLVVFGMGTWTGRQWHGNDAGANQHVGTSYIGFEESNSVFLAQEWMDE